MHLFLSSCLLLALAATESAPSKPAADPAQVLQKSVAQCTPDALIAASVPGYLAATGDAQGVAAFLDRPSSAGYALEWPFALQAYLQYTRDSELDRVSRLAEEALPFWLATYGAFKNDTGLLLNLPEGFSALPAQAPGVSGPVNALYYGALIVAADICAQVGRSHRYSTEAERVADSFAELLVDPVSGLYREAANSAEPSVAANAIALAHGLHAGADRTRMEDYIRRSSISAQAAVRPYVLGALYQSGSVQMAQQLLGLARDWVPCSPEAAITYAAHVQYTAPPPLETLQMASNDSEPLLLQAVSKSAAGLAGGVDWAYLHSLGWRERVGDQRALWIDVDAQMLYVLEKGSVVWQARMASASAGTGSRARSFRTPLGWHRVDQKIGANAPWGQVFRSRTPTKQVWKPGDNVTEDMVLTRVLWLDGLEPGKNKGKGADGVSVDSKARCIYIHGTNGEALIGTPSSHGCIRLTNDDVIKAFELIPNGALVLITERSGATGSSR